MLFKIDKIELWPLDMDTVSKIGPVGAAAIADAVRVNGALTDLNLRANDIGAAGAAAGGPNVPMPIPEDDQQNSNEEVLEATSQSQGPHLDFHQ